MRWMGVTRVVICLTAVSCVAAEATTGPPSAPVGAAAASNQSRIKVLIVDGYSNHFWQWNTLLLRGILEPTGMFDVSVSTSPPTAKSSGWDKWRPKFSDYDVVIQTCNDIKNG